VNQTVVHTNTWRSVDQLKVFVLQERVKRCVDRSWWSSYTTSKEPYRYTDVNVQFKSNQGRFWRSTYP